MLCSDAARGSVRLVLSSAICVKPQKTVFLPFPFFLLLLTQPEGLKDRFKLLHWRLHFVAATSDFSADFVLSLY